MTIVCFFATAVVILLCSMVGSQSISLNRVLQVILGKCDINIDYRIFVQIRLPRVMLAAIVGAALGTCGVTLQGLLRNPLADPYILGISSGAGLGAIIAIISGLSFTFLGNSAITIFAFTGAMLTVSIVWLTANVTGTTNSTQLLLAGVVINAIFSAVIMFITATTSSDKVSETILWLMGNITAKDKSVLWTAALMIIFSISSIFCLSHKLNIISLGSKQAQFLGVNTKTTTFTLLALSAFTTAIAVSLSGLIGFVGLIIPHGVRVLIGPDNRKLIIASAFAGASFLAIADTIARTIVAPEQLPAGVITAITGGPFFLFIMIKNQKKISWVK